jgi:glycosyltransferase involved in cell wall biosynthesis
MRIIHVVQTANGGGARLARALADHAAARGDQVTLAWPSEPDDSRSTLRNVVLPRYGRALAIARLAAGADLLHVHGARASTWSLAAMLLRPSIVTFHGLHPLRRPAGAAYRWAGRSMVRLACRLARAVICVAESEADELAAVAPRGTRIRIVRNAVAPQEPLGELERRDARAVLDLDDEALVILFAGRLRTEKGPLEAIEIVEALPAEAQAVLLLAGDGPLRAEVEEAAGQRTRVLGHVDDLRPLLAACDVVLSPSVWEGLPLGVLDAMWAGRPVVGSSIAGNAEALGDTGLLIPPNDLEGYRAALLELIDAGRRQELADAARARAAQTFSIERMLAETDQVYEEVLRAGRT